MKTKTHRAKLWLTVAGMICVAGALRAWPAWAQSNEPTEYQVKAAFLFNFTKFVEWPDAAFADGHAPIVLGILGDDPFGTELTQLVSGQSVRGRGIVLDA